MAWRGLVLGGVLLSQFPEYAQQYTQRLGGAVDELRVIIDRFRRRGGRGAGLTRAQALDRYRQAGDSFLAGRGAAMRPDLCPL